MAVTPPLKFNLKGDAPTRVSDLKGKRIRYAGQPVALVIARTPEAAAEGVRLLAPVYAPEAPVLGFDGAEGPVESVGIGAPAAASDVANTSTELTGRSSVPPAAIFPGHAIRNGTRTPPS